MGKKSKDYWVKRAEQTILDGERSVLEYEPELKLLYISALDKIQKELDAFYGKYAKDNKISLSEAIKRLNKQDLKSFREQQRLYLAEVQRIGEANTKNYVEQLKRLSARAYVTKLDALMANLRYHIETLTFSYQTGVTELLTDGYIDSFYQTTFNTQQRLGVTADFTKPSGKPLETALKEKWNEKNYSDRIWDNKEKLISEMSRTIQQGFVRGQSSRQLAHELASKMSTSQNNARRLLRTEMNYISNKATINSYRDSGVVKKFEYVATLDGRTSDICIEMDGKVFPLTEAKTGINVPPLHVHCRSTTVPYFEPDEFDEDDDRIATDENGKSYLVGKNVTYKEWASEHTEASYVKKKFKKD